MRMRVVFAGALTVLLAATGAAAQTVRGDAGAWQEVVAAYERLGKLKSYRMKMTIPGQPGSTVIEVVNPDRSRTVVQAGNVTIETVSVGKEIRFRLAGPGLSGTWQCQAPPPQAGAPPPQASQVQGDVTITRLGEVTVEGARTQGYQYTAQIQGQTVRQRLYVQVGEGLPRRVEILDPGGAVIQTLDYYDYNAPITIELPRCS